MSSFTSLEEVVSHLNAAGPDGNGNYTVYGLPISIGSMQSHVDHANKYIASLSPSLADLPDDPRTPSAQLAALDIACLGILVTGVGGSIVGAFDYFLGDLRVSRAGPYAFAIKAAIDGYKASAESNLANLASVASSVTAKAAFRVPRYRGPELDP